MNGNSDQPDHPAAPFDKLRANGTRVSIRTKRGFSLVRSTCFCAYETRIPVRGAYAYALPFVVSLSAHERERPGACSPAAPYQCTPRISAANAICSWLGASSRSAFLSPLAAAESGNSSNAVLITAS